MGSFSVFVAAMVGDETIRETGIETLQEAQEAFDHYLREWEDRHGDTYAKLSYFETVFHPPQTIIQLQSYPQ